ncbi:CPBP family intramembrane glutamic endopeptidase [Holdemania massiliensis]|uniref:CPBP family intramembrane glutamic endopeptidase n=1 Tax=Holdemania massiliensis TaxID=1468449 RepID=UPI001F056609|nr:type II CAAX endopeptidase family protein [Holdemania massiliensis]MCH1941506.1 CPBP family intramembrane metalloprotease [Holdemania massiliensis]
MNLSHSSGTKKQLGLFAGLTLIFLIFFTILYAAQRDDRLLSLLMLTPALSVLIVNRLTHDHRSLFLKPQLKRNAFTYGLSWFLPPVLAFLGAGLSFLFFPAHFQPLASSFAVKNGITDLSALGSQLIPMVLLAMLVNPFGGLLPALGEELAWRGWLLPRLQEFLGVRRAVLATSLIWGLWHAPIILLGYNYGPDHPLLGVLMQLWLCLIQGVILAWLQLKSQSVWTCALWHASLNGIDLYTASALLTAGTLSPLIGPDLTGLIGGLGFAAAAVFCWKQLKLTPDCPAISIPSHFER